MMLRKIAIAAVGAALLIGMAGTMTVAQQVDNSDIVKLELEKAAAAAAAGRATQLLRHPQTPVMGNPDGDVTLVKFTDYQCGFCKAADPRIDKLIADDPNVRVVVKEFPILGPVSVVAAKAALASVKQGKYQAFHKGMMAHRGQLKEDNIFTIAAAAGVDVAKLKVDMNAPDVADQIIDNFNLARALKVSLTPAYIVNADVLSGVSAKTSSAKIDFPQAVAAARAKAN